MLETHPWLWSLLKGEFSCRSAELHLVTNLNTILINASLDFPLPEQISPPQFPVSTHLQLVVEKLRDKAIDFTLHCDAILQGLALGDNIFPKREESSGEAITNRKRGGGWLRGVLVGGVVVVMSCLCLTI